MLKTQMPSGKQIALFPPPVSTEFLSKKNNTLTCDPRLGEHNESILSEIGFCSEEIEKLKTDEVI